MELKVNCVPVCSGMCSELDSQKVDNAVKLKRERSLRHVSEILIVIFTVWHEEPEHSMWLLCQGVLHCLSLYYSR